MVDTSADSTGWDNFMFQNPEPGFAGQALGGVWAKLCKQLKSFLSVMIKNTIPRSKDSDTVSYSWFYAYRSALLFWVAYKYRLKGIEGPVPSMLYMELNSIMGMLGNQVEHNVLSLAARRLFLAVYESQQMIRLGALINSTSRPFLVDQAILPSRSPRAGISVT
jgi:uncharacterized protein with PQ loop repeat